MRAAIVSGMVTRELPVSYWPIFFHVPSNRTQKSLQKVTRPRFPLLFKVASCRKVLVAFYINMYR